MINLIKTVARDRRGVSAIEYAIIAGVVLVVVAAGAALLSDPITARFQSAADAISG